MRLIGLLNDAQREARLPEQGHAPHAGEASQRPAPPTPTTRLVLPVVPHHPAAASRTRRLPRHVVLPARREGSRRS